MVAEALLVVTVFVIACLAQYYRGKLLDARQWIDEIIEELKDKQ